MSETQIHTEEAFDPTDPYRREAQTFPTLSEDQIARAARFGSVENLPQGKVLFERGDRTVDFFIVLVGNIEIYEHTRSGRNVFTTHRERQFTGELDLFNDREILVGGRMGADGRVIRIDRPQFRKLLAAEPDIGEIVMRAFILRRVGLIRHEQGSVTVIGAPRAADTLRLRRFLRRNGYPVRALDPEEAVEAREMMGEHGVVDDDLPVVITGGRVLRRPHVVDLAAQLGLVEIIDPDTVYDVAVVGAGPSGLAAGVYAASEGLRTVILEAEAPGGQASTSSRIENYLGFPTGVSGQALAGRAQVQAQKFGATIALPREVVALDCDSHPYSLRFADGGRALARTVVVAAGARYRTLDIDNASAFDNAGVHYAATPMEADLCRNEEVIVVGGGNSAGQAAVFLSRHAKKVHMLVRGSGLADSMSRYLVDRIESSDRIALHTRTEITALAGDRHLKHVTWTDRDGGESETRDIRHVFLMIGAVPNSAWLDDCLELDKKGFVTVGGAERRDWPQARAPFHLESSVPGVFAVGDIRAESVKRVASAVGEGSIVVQFIHRILAEQVRPYSLHSGK